MDVKPFMKVRKDDKVELSDGAEIQVIYFSNGRKEAWKGPVVFMADVSGSKVKKGTTEPKVASLPQAVSGEMKRLSKDLTSFHRTGSTQVRGRLIKEGGKFPESEELFPEDKPKVEAAKKTYEALKKASEPDDITPELYFYSVLAEFGQYQEMGELVEIMRKKQPENKEIDTLEEWIKSQG